MGLNDTFYEIIFISFRQNECNQLKLENAKLSDEVANILKDAKSKEELEKKDATEQLIKVSGLQESLAQLKIEKQTALKVQADELKKDFEDKLNDEVAHWQEKVTGLAKQIQMQQEEFELALLETKRNSESSIENVLNNANELENTNHLLQKEMDQVREQYSQLKQRFEDSEAELREIQHVKRDNDDKDQQLEEVSQQLNLSKQHCYTVEHEIAQCRSQIAELQERVNEMEQKLNEKDATIEELSNELMQKSDSSQEMHSIIDSKSEELATTRLKLGNMASELECRENDVERLMTELAEVKDQLEVVIAERENALRELNNRSTELIDQTDEEKEDLRKQLDSVNHKLVELQSDLKMQTAKLSAEVSTVSCFI